VKYADDMELLAEEETVLHGMIDSLTETGRCCGMEVRVEEIEVNETLRKMIRVRHYDSIEITGEGGILQLFV
jgi:hypothetical protein